MGPEPSSSQPNLSSIEHDFRTLLVRLSFPLSARRHLAEIDSFLDIIFPDCLQYESYVLEIVQRIPAIVDRLNVPGIDPATLRPLYEKLKVLIVRIPSISGVRGVANAMQRMRSSLSLLYSYVGEMNQGDEFAVQKSTEGDSDSSDGAIGRLLIPVVERSLVEVQGSLKESGYLREISVQITGTIKGTADVFHSQVLVLGVQGRLSNLITDPATAARALLLRMQPGLRDRFFTGFVTFAELNSFHQGSSANVAIASLIYCALLRHIGAPERYTLTNTVTATGDINERGDILPVNADSLRLKTEAVFFSGIQYFVVPKSQLPVVEDVVQSLRVRYPARELKIVGLERLEEVFFDRRLAHRSKLSVAGQVTRKAWNNRFQVLAATAVITLLLVLARNLGPGKDSNPVAAGLRGNVLQIKNARGETVDEIPLDAFTLGRAKDNDSYDLQSICKFYDVDGDGKNEFLYFQTARRDTGYNSTLYYRSLWRKFPKWERSFRQSMFFPKDPVDTDQYLTINSFIVGNFEENQKPDVFVIAHHVLYPCLVYKLNARDGTILGSYLHIGHLGVIVAADVAAIGVQQLFVAGWNSAFDCVAFAVLDPRLISGHSPSRGKYVPQGSSPGTEMYYILIPRTTIAVSMRGTEVASGPTELTIDGMKKSISLTFPDLTVSVPGSSEHLTGSLIMTFDSSMRIENVNSTSTWDQAAQILHNEGKARRIPDAVSLTTEYRNSVLYWDGRQWGRTPVMNERYLAALKELEQK